VVTTEASCQKLAAPAAPAAQPPAPPAPPATPATPSSPSARGPPLPPPPRAAPSCAVRGPALMSGLNLPGVSYQFYTTLPTQWDALVHPGAQATWGQERQARAGSQLPQSAYAPLLMPYMHFGLGQTTDYVEDLTVSGGQ